jgi:hypothetical protein
MSFHLTDEQQNALLHELVPGSEDTTKIKETYPTNDYVVVRLDSYRMISKDEYQRITSTSGNEASHDLDYMKMTEHDATLSVRVIVDICNELAGLGRLGTLDSKTLRRYESLKTNAIIEAFTNRSEGITALRRSPETELRS